MADEYKWSTAKKKEEIAKVKTIIENS